MTLYEIDQRIMELVDPETGEITDTEALTALDMERTEKLENVACWVKNLTADAAAIKAEEANLSARRKAIEAKAEHMKRYLYDALDGEKFQTPRCSVSFRRSKSLSISDTAAVAKWCEDNGFDDFITRPAPTVSKSDVKRLIQTGVEIPGAEIVESLNMGVK